MAPIKILIVNPNTNQSMTDSLRAPIDSLNYNNTTYTYLTSPPSGIPSINSPTDAALSTPATLPPILPHLPTHHAILLACYSPHPLVPLLHSRTHIPVIGIFAASVYTSLSLLRPGQRFGIVSTGHGWKAVLEEAVAEMRVGGDRFAGVETCGVDAGDLHGEGDVEGRVKGAAGRLVAGRDGGEVGVVVLGCAGMVGMEGWVREVVGEGVKVVDGVRAGVGVLQGLVRAGA